ncbi:MAG: bifunctional diaminohydroxyphosphoribosylaminopyrimidine deaminase/5-amino-6-(5-phosphoribosylamino)uracil reductase RibD [Elainella sp. Prado103]|jgi:diaminohydroxyphosphoribosylaminopyrimidine deaminase/5-amino-6-(5-phosphoribosylamino)uracil reductase|nr:bifunctional diaminohydroxyphosphoribosylaminopyrimidine deaminase/5-amino-6-(5-phosphoribosylamino)uracil reductase RibD [Elainella sp. Prado103]
MPDPQSFLPVTSFDRQMMQRCLSLARQATGYTAPNPMVGAVVVQANQVVGEGFHPKAGDPHAEVFALRTAGDRAQGATLYVNLEPCSHYGRTPPCADAVIAAGIAKVVVGMVDPNPQVAGQGIERLRAAGVEVIVGVEEADCLKLNEGFVHRMKYQRPFGILKYAMTLDGKIATSTGHSAWVTAPPARTWVHQLRSGCDAVIVGGNTVRQDHPALTSHGQGRNPLRVVMSRSLDLPLEAQLWQTEVAPTVVFTEPERLNLPEARPLLQKLEHQGVELVALESLTPDRVMQNLAQRGALLVLWESGGVLSAEAIQAGSIQKVYAFIAPKLVGGKMAPSPIGELGFTAMTQALMLEEVQSQLIGTDYLIEGYLRQAEQSESNAAG